jgi:hypothetical protein
MRFEKIALWGDVIAHGIRADDNIRPQAEEVHHRLTRTLTEKLEPNYEI